MDQIDHVKKCVGDFASLSERLVVELDYQQRCDARSWPLDYKDAYFMCENMVVLVSGCVDNLRDLTSTWNFDDPQVGSSFERNGISYASHFGCAVESVSHALNLLGVGSDRFSSSPSIPEHAPFHFRDRKNNWLRFEDIDQLRWSAFLDAFGGGYDPRFKCGEVVRFLKVPVQELGHVKVELERMRGLLKEHTDSTTGGTSNSGADADVDDKLLVLPPHVAKVLSLEVCSFGRYRKKRKPAEVVRPSGSRPAAWDWEELRPILERQCKDRVKIPESPPEV